MRLFLGLCSTSARPRASRSGGMYMPKRPRRPFLRPYQPPTGLSGERPQASTVPSAAGFCSSPLPSGIQSPFAFSMAWRSSMARSWYRSSVFPTRQTMAGGSSDSSRYIWYSDEPLGVFKSHGSSRVPVPWALSVAMFFLQSAKECDPSVAPRHGNTMVTGPEGAEPPRKNGHDVQGGASPQPGDQQGQPFTPSRAVRAHGRGMRGGSPHVRWRGARADGWRDRLGRRGL